MKIKTTFIAALLAVGFGLAGQIHAQDEMKANGRPVHSVTVRIHQERPAPRGNLRVRFLEMIEDSRCPRDVNCIQAGTARIRVRVSKNGRSQVLVLETNGGRQPAVFAGYELALYTLTPEPRSNIRINPNGYVATIQFRRV
jgi:hypothetical protein